MTELLTKTANGAVIIAVKEDFRETGEFEVVLCIRPTLTPLILPPEYVTWIMRTSDKTCYHGNYFRRFSDAAQDFNERR